MTTVREDLTAACPACLGRAWRHCKPCSGSGRVLRPTAATKVLVTDQAHWDRLVTLMEGDERGQQILAFARLWATKAQILMGSGTFSPSDAVRYALSSARAEEHLTEDVLIKSIQLLMKHWKYAEGLRSWDSQVVALATHSG